MQVTIRCYGRTRRLIDERTVTVSLNEPSTVGDALNALENRFSAFSPLETTIVLKNGTNVRNLNGFDTELKRGDEVALGDPISE